MNIRIINKNEFEDLMNLMNLSFDFKTEEEKFEHILPKYYFKDNENMVHFGLYEGDKLVSSIGVYPLDFVRNGKVLKSAMIGAVSTHPDYRGKGYFTKLMNEVMEYCNDKFDVICLTGKRERYNRFGFEYSGLSANFKIIKDSKNPCKTPIKLQKLLKNGIQSIKECLALYNTSKQHALRTEDDFYSNILSWNNVPYVFKLEDKVVGYITVKDNETISEFKYENEHLENIVLSIRENFDTITILGNYQDVENGLEKYTDELNYFITVMYRIHNYEKVIDYLDFKDFNKVNVLEKVRYIMGDFENLNRDKNTMMFVYNCDQG